jgi:hypothetical protein
MTLLVPIAATAFTLAPAPAEAAPAPATARPAKLRTVIPFIQDDYTRAVAQARARKLPLFIEAWAPW